MVTSVHISPRTPYGQAFTKMTIQSNEGKPAKLQKKKSLLYCPYLLYFLVLKDGNLNMLNGN